MFVCQMDWVFFLWILREKWTVVPMSKGYRGSTLQIWVFITSHRMLPTQSSREIAQFCHHFKENAFHLFRLFSKRVPLRKDSRMVSWRWHKWNNCHDLKQESVSSELRYLYTSTTLFAFANWQNTLLHYISMWISEDFGQKGHFSS